MAFSEQAMFFFGTQKNARESQSLRETFTGKGRQRLTLPEESAQSRWGSGVILSPGLYSV